ncbi:MAG: aromatic ring-hydroxylating dioxygenase subunit alpha [Elusimicrobia bacterium]|nr:aromatic ring-hydroxylating dioxygenase subunit alpha [Elusimicrobiota bacterium]
MAHFWYVACLSEELRRGAVVARQILGQRLAVWRDAKGVARAMKDLCLHRNAPLSSGTVGPQGLRCGYHGWVYDACGRVVEVPSLGPDQSKIGARCQRTFETLEQEGFVYVRLARHPEEDTRPFAMPKWGARGYRHIRLINRFENNLTNCVENYVDIPHTAYVHYGIFRKPRSQRLTASVSRCQGRVRAEYRNETNNLGWFSWFLNPKGLPVRHIDDFITPNITCVEYDAGPSCSFFITSQSIPVTPTETLVYTDLTYHFGLWTALAGPVVRRQGQAVIDQDVEILKLQMESLRHTRQEFTHTPADIIHVFIESIHRELELGRDPRLLPERRQEIEFWV